MQKGRNGYNNEGCGRGETCWKMWNRQTRTDPNVLKAPRAGGARAVQKHNHNGRTWLYIYTKILKMM